MAASQFASLTETVPLGRRSTAARAWRVVSDHAVAHHNHRLMREHKGGFRSISELSYGRVTTLDGVDALKNIPWCPKCRTKGSKKTSKFCKECGTRLWKTRCVVPDAEGRCCADTQAALAACQSFVLVPLVSVVCL